MTKYKEFNFDPTTINDVERSVVIYASTNRKDRYDDIIEPTAFKLEEIQSLPILFNHNQNQAIGKTLWAKITDTGLMLKIYVSDKTQLAKDCWELIKEGILSFASVGFIGIEGEPLADGGILYRLVDLIETSITPTPANPGAIALAYKSVQSAELKTIFDKQLKEKAAKDEIADLNNKLIEVDNRCSRHRKEIDEHSKLFEEMQNKINQINEAINQINEEKRAKEFKTNQEKQLKIDNIQNIIKRIEKKN